MPHAPLLIAVQCQDAFGPRVSNRRIESGEGIWHGAFPVGAAPYLAGKQ